MHFQRGGFYAFEEVSLTLQGGHTTLGKLTEECLLHRAVVSDLGCPTAVVGQNFVDAYSKLHGELKSFPGSRPFGFGAGGSVRSTHIVDLPLRMGDSLGVLQMHVIPGDLPPLMSKAAMKRAGCIIDTVQDIITGTVRGQAFKKELIESSTGHYLIPLE
jgi:hypothetical protein